MVFIFFPFSYSFLPFHCCQRNMFICLAATAAAAGTWHVSCLWFVQSAVRLHVTVRRRLNYYLRGSLWRRQPKTAVEPLRLWTTEHGMIPRRPKYHIIVVSGNRRARKLRETIRSSSKMMENVDINIVIIGSGVSVSRIATAFVRRYARPAQHRSIVYTHGYDIITYLIYVQPCHVIAVCSRLHNFFFFRHFSNVRNSLTNIRDTERTACTNCFTQFPMINNPICERIVSIMFIIICKSAVMKLNNNKISIRFVWGAFFFRFNFIFLFFVK